MEFHNSTPMLNVYMHFVGVLTDRVYFWINYYKR